MSIPSQNKNRAPTRKRGVKRVAELLESAVRVFSVKGFDGATMTEIAAGADAPIGSLYQFFPSKESLADALLARYSERLIQALVQLEKQASSLSVRVLTEKLLGLLLSFKEERTVAIALLDARKTKRPSSLRKAMREHVASVLRAKNPALKPNESLAAAVTILQPMKAIVTLTTDKEATPLILAETRKMAELYLRETLKTRA